MQNQKLTKKEIIEIEFSILDNLNILLEQTKKGDDAFEKIREIKFGIYNCISLLTDKE